MIFTNIFLMALMLVSCSDGQRDYKQIEYKKAFEQKTIEVSDTKDEIDIGYQNLKLTGILERKIDKNSKEAELLNSGCTSWEFKKSNLEGLLGTMRKVEPVEWNAVCYTFPCYYEGKVANEKKEYTIIINAASYVILTNEKETLHFILEKKSNLFLTPCDCCE